MINKKGIRKVYDSFYRAARLIGDPICTERINNKLQYEKNLLLIRAIPPSSPAEIINVIHPIEKEYDIKFKELLEKQKKTLEICVK